MTAPRRTALVIGAGIAGPVAAMALQKAGIEARVLEAYPADTGDVGAFLTVQPNGIDALRAIGADGPVQDIGFETPRLRLFTAKMRELGEVSLGRTRAGLVSRTLKRAALYRALCDEAVARGIPVEHGRRLVDARDEAGGVTAVLADGSEERADLLIGADGLRSTVRTLIDPAAPPARFLPMLNLGGYARDPAPSGPTSSPVGEYSMVFGRRAFFGWIAAPGGETWWFANPPARAEPAPGELAAITDARWRERLRDLYAGDDTPALALIDATPGPLAGWSTYDVPSVPHWHRGRMVIIGDAAHATSPSAGQGASMALEDAVVLARCLRDERDPQVAFGRFVAERRRRVEKVVTAGRRSSSPKVAGPVGRVVRDALLPLILRLGAPRIGKPSWLHDHHIVWDEQPVATRP